MVFDLHKEIIRAKRKAYDAEYDLARRNTKAKYKAKWYQEHKEECNIRSAKYYQEHKEQCNKNAEAWRVAHKEQAQATLKARRQKTKVEVLIHYGSGKLECVQCGFNGVKALSIDHINGGGNQHRRAIKRGSGRDFYSWLKQQGFPLGYQTLCMNCQFMKAGEEKEDGSC